MADFPSNMEISVSQGYSFDSSDNVTSQNVQGGQPLMMVDYSYGPIIFNVAIDADPLRMQVFQDFYYAKINSGADSFNMQLDSGNGIEAHDVYIMPETLNFDNSRWPIIVISYSVEAKRISLQDNV